MCPQLNLCVLTDMTDVTPLNGLISRQHAPRHPKWHLLYCLSPHLPVFPQSVAVASVIRKQLHFAQVWHSTNSVKEELAEVNVDIRPSLHDEVDSSVNRLPASHRARLLTVSLHPHCVSITQPAYLLT